MTERTVQVKLKLGLQARQAALFVQEANRFSADIFLEKDEKKSKCQIHYGCYELSHSKRHRGCFK